MPVNTAWYAEGIAVPLWTGLLRSVVKYMVTDVSEEHNASFGIESNCEDESSKLPQNALTHFTLQHGAVSSNNTKTRVIRL